MKGVKTKYFDDIYVSYGYRNNVPYAGMYFNDEQLAADGEDVIAELEFTDAKTAQAVYEMLVTIAGAI